MKVLASVFLLLTFCKVVVVKTQCPDKNSIKSWCECYEATGYMSCTKLDDNFLQSFKPKTVYNLNTLVISDSPDLPLLTDHTDHSSGIKAKTVIFSSKKDLKVPDNVKALVEMAQEALEINNGGPTILNIDAEFFNVKLTALSLNNVKVNNLSKLKQAQMKILSNIKLNKVSLNVEKLTKVTISLPALTRLEITNCDALDVPFQFIPTKCNKDRQIELILQNNKNLKIFKMDEMFKNQDCKYYIDLSGSALNETFLIDNNKLLKDAAKNPGQLYIILRDINLKCGNCVYDWYFTMKGYVHSVKCSNIKIGSETKYLDQVTATDVKNLPCTP